MAGPGGSLGSRPQPGAATLQVQRGWRGLDLAGQTPQLHDALLSPIHSRSMHPPTRSCQVGKYCTSSFPVGKAVPVLLSPLLHENTAVSPASCSGLAVRGGHLCAPTTVAACHCAFEVVPDFPVCLKSLAVYVAAGPASPPRGPSMLWCQPLGTPGRQPLAPRGWGGGRMLRCHWRCLWGLLD